MSTYYLVAILRRNTEVTVDSAVRLTVSQLMAPFDSHAEGVPAERRRWDSYSCCEKKGLEEWIPNYGSVIENGSLFIFPADAMTANGVPYAIVSPERQWIQSNATTQHPEDPQWISTAIHFCKNYPGHHAVLIRCMLQKVS